jgi:hypothetical protein
MAQVKVVFFIPIKDNDGRELVTEKNDLEMELYLRFVGWTFLGIVQGAYRMEDGTRAIDEHRAYAIVLDESRIPEVEEVLREFKAKTTQEAIYLEVQYHVELRLV